MLIASVHVISFHEYNERALLACYSDFMMYTYIQTCMTIPINDIHLLGKKPMITTL